MKNPLKLLILVFLITTIRNYSYAQIKIDDGSYSPDINGMIKEAEVLPAIPTYSSLFEESTEMKRNNRGPIQITTIAPLNIRYNDRWSFKDVVNPVGETIYIPSDNYPKRLFLNHKEMTATVKSIPKGYYTIVGWFGKFDGCFIKNSEVYNNKTTTLESVLAHYEMLDDYVFDNEYNKDWAHALFLNYQPSWEEGWVELYQQDKENIERWIKRYRKDTNHTKDIEQSKLSVFLNYAPCIMPLGTLDEDAQYEKTWKSSFYILQDQNGNDYYDFNGDYISVECYNRIRDLLLNKGAVLKAPEKDYLSGKEISSAFTSENAVYYCKDIFLRDNKLIGVFSKKNVGEFTVRLVGYCCCWFDGIGYKGVAVIENRKTIYPVSYLELIKNAKETEQKNIEAEKQRQKEEMERKKEQKRLELVASYGEKWGNLIARGKVAIGMNKEMCRKSIGYPLNVYKKTTSEGKFEVWEYSSSIQNTRLYFLDDKLFSIDTAM